MKGKKQQDDEETQNACECRQSPENATFCRGPILNLVWLIHGHADGVTAICAPSAKRCANTSNLMLTVGTAGTTHISVQ